MVKKYGIKSIIVLILFISAVGLYQVGIGEKLSRFVGIMKDIVTNLERG